MTIVTLSNKEAADVCASLLFSAAFDPTGEDFAARMNALAEKIKSQEWTKDESTESNLHDTL